MNRRQLLWLLTLGLGPPALVASYGYGFETRNLTVERVQVSLPGFSGKMRAVHLSDLHFRGNNGLLGRVRETVQRLRPDRIFVTGDLVDEVKYLDACLDWISGFNGTDMYFSAGNWEHWSGSLESGLIARLREVGVETLFNDGKRIGTAQSAFYLAGIDDAYYGSPDAVRAFSANTDRLPAIVLSHSPLGVNVTRPMRPGLILSGHTHGGQIRIPGYGAIKTPPGSGSYEQGMYSEAGIKLYVNRGIGTSIIPFRMFCPPEIALIEITGA